MKKLLSILTIVSLVLWSTGVFAAISGDGPQSAGGVVRTASECNAAAYYPDGTLCQDTDDNKLYLGTGAAVVEIGKGDTDSVGDCASGACLDGSSDGGTYIRLYDGTSAYISQTAGVRTLTILPSNTNAESLVITFGNNDNTVALGSGTGASVSINGNAGTASALAANGANCSSGQAPLGVDASGAVESCFAVQASDAELTALAGLTFADVSIIQLTGDGAAAVLTCTANQLIGANSAGDAIECKSSLNVSTIYLPSSDADPGTAAGNIRHDSTDTDASAGGIVEWYDGTNTRRVVDGAASAAANYTVIVKTEFIPVAWMTDGAAAPGALTTYETTKYRDFADDATKDLQFIWMTPLDLIGTTIKVRAIAMVTNATAPADEEGVSWGISAAAVAGSASVDAARGTEVFSEDTDLDNDCNAQYDVCYFPYVEVTPAVTVTAGTLMAFTINRDHDNDDDTYAQDIGLIGVEIKYKARINLVDTW